ncbi:MAG: alpha/beta hydrolase [Bacteroidales bacterium]|nr:alpha/beta hydrolase [Bacteroidales bacterium]
MTLNYPARLLATAAFAVLPFLGSAASLTAGIHSYSTDTVPMTDTLGTFVPACALGNESFAGVSEILLYPQGQDVDMGIVENGTAVTLGPGCSNGFTQPEEVNEWGNVSHVGDRARIQLFFPEHPNGQMVVVCPGGGYSTVCATKEGYDVAKWMTRKGISVCVVVYRLPNGRTQAPLTDVQNAFRYCRAHAQDWGVSQIGVMGFSAGGHLAAMASNLFVDEITRPDFSVLIYPVIDLRDHEGTCLSLVGEDAARREEYSMQHRVSARTPRTFMALSQNDKVVAIRSSLDYFDALKAAGVCPEMYIFPTGGHGYGFLQEEKGGRKDAIGPDYRPLFMECLSCFLENVKK